MPLLLIRVPALALGAVQSLQGERLEASATFAEAGQYAAANELPVLAIEGYRLAGHWALEGGREAEAMRCWQRGVELAKGASGEQAPWSSAGAMARALAEACERHGLPAQATSLRAYAAGLERAPEAPAVALEGG
jgi:hypothetical protein